MIGVALDAVVVPVVILTVVSVVCASIAEVDDGNGDDRVGAECRLVTRACSRFKFMAISRQDRFSIRSWLGRSAFVRL